MTLYVVVSTYGHSYVRRLSTARGISALSTFYYHFEDRSLAEADNLTWLKKLRRGGG